MTGSRVGFEQGSIAVHQMLAVRQGGRGESGVPLTRADWYLAERQSAVEV
jgi:hypothetical protein